MRKKRSLSTRIWAKVDFNGTVPEHRPELGNCWIWTGWRDKVTGYGRVGKNELGTALVHRIVWILTRGPITDGLCVLHACDNPPCVRHLFLGTQADNAKDRDCKGRTHTGRRNGIRLSDEDVIEIRRLLALGVPQSKITDLFPINQQMVSNIKLGVSYRHVA